MSKFSAKGLSVKICTPLIQGGDAIEEYSEIIESYSHTISAVGGFTSASISAKGNHEFLENWLQNGLGRHIEVYNPQQSIIWEGFVNELTVTMGGATFTKGPLVNIGNRVLVMYTPLYDKCSDLPVVDPNCTDTGVPISGTPTETYLAEDLFSQSLYGIWEKIVNQGDLYTEDAESIRDLYLAENAYPEGNSGLSISSSDELGLTLSCSGYRDFLNYPYNYTTDEISHECDDMLKDILAEDPNGVISTDYTRIDDNPAIKVQYTDENKTANSLIDEILAIGGEYSERWTFGIYKNRQIVYSAIPTAVEYYYYKAGSTLQVETVSGRIVEPWDVVPCKWVGIPTVLASFGIKLEDIRNDPRIFFAEEVNFTAPDQVTISGAKIRKFNQYLASMGIGG